MSKRLPSPPPVIEGYSYIRPLGTGGFADVFLYEQNMPRRLVAVKVLMKDFVDDELLRMFNTEADVMARLSAHPSILTVYQASVSADGRPYLVIEHCPSSLTTRYRREQMSVPEVLHIGVKIGSALETAHRAGLLHRDIKPSNILFTAFGAPVLADFGIASSVKGSATSDFFAMSVPWSSPEVVEEKITGSISAEVWSMGATVYSLLAGASPFERQGAGLNSREQLRSRISKARYTEIDRDDVPPSLQRVLEQSMRKNPQERQERAVDLAHDLQLVQHELGLAHTPLEVADDEWASAGIQIDFSNNEVRGPVRSTVGYESRRPGRAKAPSGPMPDLDGTVLAGRDVPASKTVSVRTAVLIGLGAAVVIAAIAVVVLVAVLNS